MPSSTEPRTPQEIERWAHSRRPHEREAVPHPGERLLFRGRDFGDPVPAVVDAVQDLTAPNDHWGLLQGTPRHQQMPDPNVWAWDETALQWRMKDDPWPWVTVRVIQAGDGGGEVLTGPRWCKEARVRGSVGWLRPGTRAHHGNYTEE